MTTVINVSLNDLSSQFINDLKQKFGQTTKLKSGFRINLLPTICFRKMIFGGSLKKSTGQKKVLKTKSALP